MLHRNRQSGNVGLEFTLVGIPVLFVLISVINISYVMMTMHTMQAAAEQTARYVIGHGSDCAAKSNSCTTTVGTIAVVMTMFNAGVNPHQLQVTLTTASGASTSCNPLASCQSNSTVWPPSSNGDNQAGKDIMITASYPCYTVIGIFWPGAGNSNVFGKTVLQAYARQRITF